jgi:alkylation response protein AidB-like acyl-CoA dehydrogenase
MSTSASRLLKPDAAGPFAGWLDDVAHDLDTSTDRAAEVLPALAAEGLLGIGVPEALGGAGGTLIDAVAAVAEVSSHSLAAGFVLWGHRTYIEYLLQSPNETLRARLLPDLLDGSAAGATGLSNAMKHLEGLEELQFSARADGEAAIVDGKLPWVTNLRRDPFHVAVAVAREDGATFVASLSSEADGVVRSPDLDLLGLRATNTAAITVSQARVSRDDVIHPDARAWLPQVRPAFLGLQCGMSIGLARRSLHEARQASGSGRNVLQQPVAETTEALDRQERALLEGLKDDAFHTQPARLFQIRIALADVVSAALGLELQASGGRAYLSIPGRAFARRWREAAFIPVITPSIVQLRTALTRHLAVPS